MRLLRISLIGLFALCCMNAAMAEAKNIPLLVATQSANVTNYSVSIKILAAMTLLTVLPALLITTTAFTRIVVVLAILRQAIGIPNVPSNQILIGLSLIMTIFVMSPILEKINNTSIQPYMDGKLDEENAVTSALSELKLFMLKQTHKKDLNLFYKLAHIKPVDNDHPLIVVLPAYITSELKTAFEIGFLIFIPFLIIDLVVSSILMSIGMMMLSPMIISLPFKILFFVLVDGWGLIATSLVTSFRV